MKTSRKKPALHKEKRDIRGSLVQTADGTHFRKNHKREMDVTNDAGGNKKYPWVSSNLNNSMRNGVITKMSDIRDGKGITDGVKKVEMDDPKSGKKVEGFFKDIDREPIVHKSQAGEHLLRSVVKLRDRVTDEPLSIGDHKEARDKPDHDRKNVKGHLMDREVAVASLGKALKMDHLPDASIRRVKDVDGKDRLGFMVRDINDQFPSKTMEKGSYSDGMRGLKKTDPKLGDKLAFDLMIGNTDRHGGNYFVRDGKEMLAFDQGLSFPDNNGNYVDKNFTNQETFMENARNIPLTNEFAKNFGEFLGNGDFEKMHEFIKDNIGGPEADAFTERMVFFADNVFNKKYTTLSSMNFEGNNQKQG